MKDVLILGGGEDKLPIKTIKTFKNIICADSGYDYIVGKIQPIAVIGDFDSIKKKIKNNKIEIIKYSKNKDKLDTELAIQYAINKGFENIFINGVNGTRIDQFYTVIKLLYKYKKYNLRIITHTFEIFLLKNSTKYVFENMKGKTISLFSLSAKTYGFKTVGLEYNLNKIELKKDSPIGVSNTIKKSKCKIYFEKGLLLCYIEI